MLTHGSLALIVLGLLVAGLGVPVPEDPLLVAAGVLAHNRGLPLWLVIGVCFASVLAADFTLFSIARHYGPALLDRRFAKRLLPPARRERLTALLEKRGDAVVFTARHLPGLRSPIFALAGIQGMRPARFLLWDALGLLITAPLVTTLGWLGSAHVDLVLHRLAAAEHWVASVAVILGAVAWLVMARRRRLRLDRSQL